MGRRRSVQGQITTLSQQIVCWLFHLLRTLNCSIIELRRVSVILGGHLFIYPGSPWWCSGKGSACQCRRCRRDRLDLWVEKISWNRKWQPSPVFLPEKFHGQRSLVDYSPWCCKEMDMTEQLSTHYLRKILHIFEFLSALKPQMWRGPRF